MPMILYQDQGGPNDMTIDQDFVYWSSYSSGLIQRISKSGGSAQLLTQVARLESPYVAVDDTNLYFTTEDATGNDYVAVLAKDGGPVTMLASNLLNGHEIRAQGSFVYWLTGTIDPKTPGGLQRVSKGGGPTETLSPNYQGTGAVTVDDQYAYWTVRGDLSPGQGQILRVATTGSGVVETLLTGIDSPYRLVTDSNRLYVGVGSTRIAVNGVFNGQVVSWDKLAAPPAHPQSIATNQPGLVAVAVDDSYAYWVVEGVGSSSILKAPKAGGAVTTLATGQAGAVAIAVDDQYVFWINSSIPNGAVMRLAK